MTTYNNFSISSGKGKLYLKEKQPTEGYEEITYGTEGKKTYHRYFDSIKGIPTQLEAKSVDYDGKTLKFLELTLTDGDVSNKVSVPLKNTKGGYTDESRVLISALNGLDLGEEVTLSTKTTTTTAKNGKEYKNLNVYINYVNRLGDNGKGLSTGFIPYNDIPPPTQKIVAGDKVWDWTPQTEFFYEKLQEISARFPSKETNNPAPQPTQGSTPPKSNEQPVQKPEVDKLPF